MRVAAEQISSTAADHAVAVAAALGGEIGEYAAIDVAALVPGVTASVAAGMAAVAERRDPTATELDQVRRVAEDRARQGLSVAALVAAYHSGARLVCDVLCQEAGRRGASDRLLREVAERVWRWAALVSAHAADAHQQTGNEIIRHDQQRRGEFLRAVLYGLTSPSEIMAQAAAYQVVADRAYLPFRAQLGAGADPLEIEARLVETGSTPDRPALVGLVDGCLAGILVQGPDLTGRALTLVLGPAAHLADIPASFRLACRGVQAAVGFGLTGVHAAAALALPMAVAADEFLGECMTRRYLDPLRQLRGPAQEVEATLASLLACGMRVEEAARECFLHPNTVRHRLHRFQQVTGADLGRTDDVIGLWWALQRRRWDRSAHPDAVGSDVTP